MSTAVRLAGDSNEEYLLQLWRTQLNAPNLRPTDDFFEAGGSSMQVIEMLMTVAEKFGKEIDFAEFFKGPCVIRLSELLDA
jgi:acyl carrier protein